MSINFICSSYCYNGYQIISKKIFFLLLILSQHSVIFVYAVGSEEEKETISASSAGFWAQVLAIFALVICSGIVAGLTLGLMSLDATNLAILSTAGTAKQQKYAARILPIRKNAHLLLTSLLLTNTVLNETLPILCDGLFGEGYVAVIISTALVFIFAEIIPQAICSRHGLAIGAFFAIPVRVLIGFWYILAWPIAKLLDTILGKHDGTIYGVPELRELIHLHSEKPLSSNDNQGRGPLQKDTVKILQNTLDLSLYSAGDLINSTQQRPFMLHIDTQLDSITINTILQSECINIPVYKYDQCSHCRIILGVLKSKYLSILNPADKTPLNKITIEPIKQVSADTSAITLLKILENDNNRMVQVVLFMNSIIKDNNNHNNPNYKSKRSSVLSTSFNLNKTFRHGDRSSDNNESTTATTTIDETRRDEMNYNQKDIIFESDSSSSSTCSSSGSHHQQYVSYAQDVRVLGIITFEELLKKLIRSNTKEEKETLLTNVLIHNTIMNEKGEDDNNNRSILQQQQSIHNHRHSSTNNVKNEEVKGCNRSDRSNSNTTESTIILKSNSITES